MPERDEQLCPKFQVAMKILAALERPVISALTERPPRFGELSERLAPIGDRILSQRLKDLEQLGLVERRVLPGPPVRVEYTLSDIGPRLLGGRGRDPRLGREMIRVRPTRRPEEAGPPRKASGRVRRQRSAGLEFRCLRPQVPMLSASLLAASPSSPPSATARSTSGARDFVRWQLEQGTDGLVPCGTTGEARRSPPTSQLLVQACVEESRAHARVRGAGPAPVIAGYGSNSTAQTIANVRIAKEAGADAALVVTPCYNKPSQEGSSATSRPVARAAGCRSSSTTCPRGPRWT